MYIAEGTLREREKERSWEGKREEMLDSEQVGVFCTIATDQSTLSRPPLAWTLGLSSLASFLIPISYGSNLQPRSPASPDYRLRRGSPDIFRWELFRSDFEFQCIFLSLLLPSSNTLFRFRSRRSWKFFYVTILLLNNIEIWIQRI